MVISISSVIKKGPCFARYDIDQRLDDRWMYLQLNESSTEKTVFFGAQILDPTHSKATMCWYMLVHIAGSTHHIRQLADAFKSAGLLANIQKEEKHVLVEKYVGSFLFCW